MREARAKAASLPPEPPVGAQGVTRIAIRLPDGKRLDRRFHVDDTVDVRGAHGGNVWPAWRGSRGGG